MPKRITYLTKRESLSRAEFSEHWSGVHARIAINLPGVLAYRQNHVIPDFSSENDVDGIVELWFTSEADASAGFGSEVADRLIVDEPRFLDGLAGAAVDATDPLPAQPGKVWVLVQPSSTTVGADLNRWANSARADIRALHVAVDLLDNSSPILTRTALSARELPSAAVSFAFASVPEASAAAERVRRALATLAGARATVYVAEEVVIV